MIAPYRCVHGIAGRCELCRIDQRARIGAATTERILAGIAPFVSGVCSETIGDHERCRMIGCECQHHARDR